MNQPTQEAYQYQRVLGDNVQAQLGSLAERFPTIVKNAEELAHSAKRLHQHCIIIPVAAHQETGNISHTLTEYAAQSGCDPFTVVLYPNCPPDHVAEANIVLDEIARATDVYPNLDIRSTTLRTYDPTTTNLGMIRNDIWNSVLLLAYTQGYFADGSDLYGHNHDIDLVTASPHYMQRVQEYTRSAPLVAPFLTSTSYTHSPMGTRLRNHLPTDLPNLAKVIGWIDAAYLNHATAIGYEAGLVIPMSAFAYAEGFADKGLVETRSITLSYPRIPLIPRTNLMTSARCYIERLPTHSIDTVWDEDAFGATDECRTSLSRHDISRQRVEELVAADLASKRSVYEIGVENLFSPLWSEASPRCLNDEPRLLAQGMGILRHQRRLGGKILREYLGLPSLAKKFEQGFRGGESRDDFVDSYCFCDFHTEV